MTVTVRRKTAVFIKVTMMQRGKTLAGALSLFLYLYLCLVCVYFSTVQMSPHTWAFWATQLNVVSKTHWLLTVAFLNQMHNILQLLEFIQPEQTDFITTDQVYCLQKRKSEVPWNIKRTLCVSAVSFSNFTSPQLVETRKSSCIIFSLYFDEYFFRNVSEMNSLTSFLTVI